MQKKQGKLNSRSQAGFTLIELMLAIAIVAILVAMAVPAYQDYAIRSKISECINNAAVPKVNISEYRQSLGAFPTTADEAGLTDDSGNTDFCVGFSSYSAADGSFFIDVDEAAIESSLTQVAPQLTPFVNTNNFITWNCTVGDTPPGNIRYLPATCRDT